MNAVSPVYEPCIGEEEASSRRAIRCGEISGSFGESIRAFERRFADFIGRGMAWP